MAERAGPNSQKSAFQRPPAPQEVSQFVSRPRYRRRARSHSPRRRGRYSALEKCAMLGLFCIAWAWVAVTVAVLTWSHRWVPGFGPGSRSILPVSPEAVAHGWFHSGSNRSALLTPDEAQQREPSQPNPPPFRKKSLSSQAMPSSSVGTYLEAFQSPLLVITCRRPAYLRQTLEDIYKFRDESCRIGCPLIISQDGHDEDVVQVIQAFQKRFATVGIPLIHLQHKPGNVRKPNAYKLLAVHYGWALGQVFGNELGFETTDSGHQTLNAQRVIILEEDIHIAVDFFSFFAAMAPLLDGDPSLLAVSAFNDNGFPERVSNQTRVLRSDFFPGLGWMMTRKLWDDELASKWPPGYWDDWLREPDQRRGRHILRPEISRTFHFGSKGGASQNQFGSKLSHVLLEHDAVDWTRVETTSSLSEDHFDRQYFSTVNAAVPVDNLEQAQEQIKYGNVRLQYTGIQHFAELAGQAGLMTDEKAGVPRTAYKGVVETRLDGKHLLFFTPPMDEIKDLLAHTY